MDLGHELRTLTLTERVASCCRLSRAEVAFLQRGHRAHLDLAPTARTGHYRITPTGHVGTILAPEMRVVIRPKIPLENLFHLLDPNAPVPAFEDKTATVPGAEAFNFLARRLAELLAERVSAGLHRDYAERVAQGPYLQGRLDLPAQLRERRGRKDLLHCRYEDFTADVPCNQVVKATAEWVLRSPLLGEGVAAALRRTLPALAAVSPAQLGPDCFADALPDRRSAAYRPVLALCRLLFEGLNADRAAGPVPCPAFLLNMEEVFEGYVSQGVRQSFKADERCAVSFQPPYLIGQPVAGQPDLRVRPDIVVERAGKPVLVVDAKWKSLAEALVPADVYQVLAYCTALGARRGVLVYPGRRTRRWTYRLTAASLEVHTVRVTGAPPACRRSLDRFGRHVHSSASPSR